LQAEFAPVAQSLSADEEKIISQLNAAQGHSIDLGGYYHPDPEKTSSAMRPSQLFNAVIDQLLANGRVS
jgi:isocitrate dehydrogenase